MKKLICISILTAALSAFSFADVLLSAYNSISPLVLASEYSSYNIPHLEDYPNSNIGGSILFSLPHPEHFNFYVGPGTSIITSDYGFPAICLTLNGAVSYSFHEEKWPRCEILLLTNCGAGFSFIKSIEYYMFANAAPYFTFMPAKDKNGFFFGFGPHVGYLQAANWEFYNQITVGLSAIGGYRWH